MKQQVAPTAYPGDTRIVVLEFRAPEALLAAAQATAGAGFRTRAYSPFHIEGLAQAIGARESRVALACLCGALTGGIGGFLMQWYSAVVDRPLNVGGRPLFSWPMFVPVAFSMLILGGALAALAAFLIGSRLPRLRYPIFDAPRFDRSTRNRFFLAVEVPDGEARARFEAMRAHLRPAQRFELSAGQNDALPVTMESLQ